MPLIRIQANHTELLREAVDVMCGIHTAYENHGAGPKYEMSNELYDRFYNINTRIRRVLHAEEEQKSSECHHSEAG